MQRKYPPEEGMHEFVCSYGARIRHVCMYKYLYVRVLCVPVQHRRGNRLVQVLDKCLDLTGTRDIY